MSKLTICIGCGEEKPHHAKGRCRNCYQRQRTRKTAVCTICGAEKPHHARGMCNTCYQREYSHETGRCQPMRENKSCTSYLGVYVAERVLAKVFDNIEVMPYGNLGYDFLCGRGYKIDVKSTCLRKDGRWSFNTNRNTTADYFLCLAFDNRTNLTPIHVWLLPGDLVNHLYGASISTSTLDKWCEYELSIDKVNIQCDLLRSKMEIK